MLNKTGVEAARLGTKVNEPSSQATIGEHASADVTHEMIEKRSYEIWLTKQHLGHEDTPVENWLAAERELKAMPGK